MTQVLSIQPDGHAPFASSLHPSSSQGSLYLQTPSNFSRSSQNLGSKYSTPTYDARLPASEPSSAPTSPRLKTPAFSGQPSYTSTPSSSLSLDYNCAETDADLSFPSYDPRHPFDENDNSVVESQKSRTTTPTSAPSAPTPSQPYEPDQTVGDDMALSTEPTRHVDYLSHAWKEEDIWSSWRHITARRKLYTNSSRLENASWRSWAKSKYRLKTISPETLNWMKDHDVTWLYGPLQPGKEDPLSSVSAPLTETLSRSNSFGAKKPILKKRSLSELMLQKSVSSSTLVRQATDALHAQQTNGSLCERPILKNRKISDFTISSGSETSLTRPTTGPGSSDVSTSTSGLQTPSTSRHIHFNDKVEQCIAINKDNDDHFGHVCAFQEDEDSSDDDLLMMKPVKHATKAKISRPSTPRNSFSQDSKTIAMLPSTTLKYRGDTPEPGRQQSRQKEPVWSSNAKIHQSPSQQTIKASSQSTSFLLDDEDDDADLNWQPSAGRRSSIFPSGGLEINSDDEEESFDHSGLRRTPSGMFMPDDDDPEDNREGILGKVVDTVNTAKDIAHVIWNVGWRR